MFYPEIQTPIQAKPPTEDYEPPPPPDLFYVAVQGAYVPQKTRDGRPWDQAGNGAPDPYVVVIIDGKELFRTGTQRDSYEPTWPEAPKRNYTIPKDATLKIELWNDNPIYAQPICHKTLKRVREEARGVGEIRVTCDGGASVSLDFEPARARWGLGFFYELRGSGAAVTRVLRHSPATRAGLRGGEQLVTINGRSVSGMDEKQIRSAINANIKTGLKLEVRSGGANRNIEVQEGPIYSLVGE